MLQFLAGRCLLAMGTWLVCLVVPSLSVHKYRISQVSQGTCKHRILQQECLAMLTNRIGWWDEWQYQVEEGGQMLPQRCPGLLTEKRHMRKGAKVIAAFTASSFSPKTATKICPHRRLTSYLLRKAIFPLWLCFSLLSWLYKKFTCKE